MRRVSRLVGVLGLTATVAAGGCGSSSQVLQPSANAGAAGSAAAAAGTGGSAAGSFASAGGAGADGAGVAGASGAGEGGAPTNLYIDAIRSGNPDTCLPRSLPFGAKGTPNEGRVACTIAEVHFNGCDCELPGRAALSAELLTAIQSYAEEIQVCGAASGVDCASACGCGLVQLLGTSVDAASDLYACQNEVTPPAALSGFCVIDREHTEAGEPAPIGNGEIVASCPSRAHRRIRFVGEGLPAMDALLFLACTGSLAEP